MKNSIYRNYVPSSGAMEKHRLEPLAGFHGYYVDRFNDIYSFYTKDPFSPIGEGKQIKIHKNRTKDRVLECCTLFDNGGKRCFRSRRKVLVASIGKEEFERREEVRKDKADILAKEQKEFEAWKKKADAESEKMLQEMHKDDFKHQAPLNTLDPVVANMVKKARAKREQEALGDLF